MKKPTAPKRSRSRQKAGIVRITVSGYKSIIQEQSIEIRPLTILAGANSSGKSSIMQPLLLLKQTLEATYDPGALLLNGPNVRFTSVDQLLSRVSGKRVDTFSVGIGVGNTTLATYFNRQLNKGIEIKQMTHLSKEEETTFRMGMSQDEIMAVIPSSFKELHEIISAGAKVKPAWVIVRNRCFLDLALQDREGRQVLFSQLKLSLSEAVEPHIRGLIHVPGLRGNPERNYPVTAVGSTFPGTFEKYVASVIAQWQANEDDDRLGKLNKDLESLGLTWKVTAKPISDTEVELQVGRLIHAARGGAHDLVSIADVGFGVSQTLPVLVALHAAEPGQLVYLEQPEIHLHPNAQVRMAYVLAEAANRGVRMVVETHSSLLLLGIQSLVAEGELSPDRVKLHWFQRHDDGATEVKSADLNEVGAFGDWPEDFAQVALEAESRYLDAAEARQRKN
jgi:predicted ATPase